MPNKAYLRPGYRASDASLCVSNKLNGKYCGGQAKGETCDKDKFCDVGLYCSAGTCAALLADGADCTTGQCQPNSLCYPDKKCKKWHQIANGQPAANARFCQSGYTLNGNCTDRPTVEKEWFDNATDLMKACNYSDKSPWPGMCITYSKDPKQAGYCMNFGKFPMTKYMDYVNKYAANSCPESDVVCDKAADAYGCANFKDFLREYYYMLTYMETQYPDCEDKMVTRSIDEYKCFAKELVWGFLTVLAIALMI